MGGLNWKAALIVGVGLGIGSAFGAVLASMISAKLNKA